MPAPRLNGCPHLLVTDGASRPDGAFLHLGFHDDPGVDHEILEELEHFVRRAGIAPVARMT